jgi:putative membrane protein
MLFIDFVSLLLVNMVAGHFLLAAYVYRGLDQADSRGWVPGFAITGLVAAGFGAHMTVHWPLPGAYNSAYGEMSVLFGVIFLGAALAMALRWSLLSVAVYAFFAGWAAIVLGLRILDLGMTLSPTLSGVGFILSGLGGVFAAPTLAYFRHSRLFRTLGALVLAAAGAIWALTVYMGYWMHMDRFSKWVPTIVQETTGH